MLRPLGSKEGPSTGPSTGPSRRRSGASRRRSGGFFNINRASFIINCLYLCHSFFERHTPKGVGLRVADSHTGNHREDDFTPPETFKGFPSAFRM
ncbi:hypothetical protein Tco_0763143 [Tanacetum coccineum]